MIPGGAPTDATAVRVFTNLTPPKVLSGAGSLGDLVKLIEPLGAHRCLLVTGASVGRSDLVARIQKLLGIRWAGTFSQVAQHVPSGSVIAASRVIRGLEADVVIAVGGGSAIDTARAAVAVSVAPDQFAVGADLGFDELRAISAAADRTKMPRLVTVSTTLSGAEWTPYAGVTDERTKIKHTMRHTGFVASVAVLDPEVTVETPLTLWLSTGMRAVDHCVESLYAQQGHPLIETLAFRSLGLLRSGLLATKRDPRDLAARAACQYASWFSFFSIDTVMIGPSHGLGHQVGSLCDVPHGVTSCILLPGVMRYLRPQNARRQRVIAEALGVATEHMSDEQAAAEAEGDIRRLVVELGLPTRLRDVGVRHEDLSRIAANALGEQIGMMRATGVVLDHQEQLLEILESVY